MIIYSIERNCSSLYHYLNALSYARLCKKKFFKMIGLYFQRFIQKRIATLCPSLYNPAVSIAPSDGAASALNKSILMILSGYK